MGIGWGVKMRLSSYIASSTSLPGSVRQTKFYDLFIDALKNPGRLGTGITIGLLPFVFTIICEMVVSAWTAILVTVIIGGILYVLATFLQSLGSEVMESSEVRHK